MPCPYVLPDSYVDGFGADALKRRDNLPTAADGQMISIPPPLRVRIATIEQYTGWMCFVFALTMAIGNPSAILYRVAEDSTTRGLWVASFMALGSALMLAPLIFGRRPRFILSVVTALHWGFFGAQALAVGAAGATAIALVVVGHMVFISEIMFRRGWG